MTIIYTINIETNTYYLSRAQWSFNPQEREYSVHSRTFLNYANVLSSHPTDSAVKGNKAVKMNISPPTCGAGDLTSLSMELVMFQPNNGDPFTSSSNGEKVS